MLQLTDNLTLARAHSGDPLHWHAPLVVFPAGLHSFLAFVSMVALTTFLVPGLVIALVYLLDAGNRRLRSAGVLVGVVVAGVVAETYLSATNEVPDHSVSGAHFGWPLLLVTVPVVVVAFAVNILIVGEPSYPASPRQ
jgi:predicted neutral ceramidase superfamily lipid hydrolase